MLVNYFKLKNISSRGRIIALSLVGGVFILLILLALWNRNFADTLIGYASDDAVLYVHFSRPKINDPVKIDQVLAKIFSDLGLADYDSLDINREVAVIGRLKNDQIKYGVIIKTDRPSKVKQILSDAQLKYKSLSYNTFLLAEEDWLSDYKRDKNNLIKSKIAKRFYPLSSINIYASPPFFSNSSNDLNLGFIYSLFKNENNDLILSFKAKGSELKVFYGGISSVVRSQSKFTAQNVNGDISGDVIFFSSDFYSLLKNWKDNLKGVSTDDYNSFVNGKLNTYLNTYLSADNRHVFLVARKNNNNSGWLFNDYDFYVSLEKIYPAKIEEILKIIMAERYPVIKNTYLSDGTNVAELLPDIKQFNFLDKNGVKYVDAPDGQFKLMYKSVGDNIVITNSESLLNQNWPIANANYLKFKSDFLSDNGLGRYLKFFDFLEVNSRGIILK